MVNTRTEWTTECRCAYRKIPKCRGAWTENFNSKKKKKQKTSIVYLSKKGLNLGSTTSVRLGRIYSTST